MGIIYPSVEIGLTGLCKKNIGMAPRPPGPPGSDSLGGVGALLFDLRDSMVNSTCTLVIPQ